VKTYPLLISCPDCDLFRGEAQMLILRGTEGDLAVMAGHIPFVTGVVEGHCVVVTDTGERKEGTIAEGILTVSGQSVTVLTSSLVWDK
jgi:F-type H+-transporting ATPase subunit epsilon